MSDGAIRERVVTIGAPTPLIGVYACQTTDKPAAFALILLNSGVIHRVGSCRLTVKIARSITSDLGIPTLRFDYSGIGDSEPRRSTQDRDQLAVEEVIEAMDFMSAAYGIKKFAIYGLCSGARDAFRASVRDNRVIAIAQVDGYAYRNVKYYISHYRERVFDIRHWFRYLFESIPKHASKLFNKNAMSEKESMFVPEWEPYPPRQAVASDYAALVRRGVKFYVLFTGSWVAEYNYASQFFDMFREVNFAESVTLRYRRNTNHIHSDLTDQALLMRELGDWCGSIQ